MKRLIVLSVVAAAVALAAPVVALADDAKSPPGDETKKITFEDHIKPIFRQHCLSCHNQGEKRGGIALDSYQAMLEGGGSGEVVFDDGDFESSRLW
ncbi:MAG: c-type cytochrome domain-containing protein, partial [Planctomycetota bacterium]